jgi:hypothetical protein
LSSIAHLYQQSPGIMHAVGRTPDTARRTPHAARWTAPLVRSSFASQTNPGERHYILIEGCPTTAKILEMGKLWLFKPHVSNGDPALMMMMMMMMMPKYDGEKDTLYHSMPGHRRSTPLPPPWTIATLPCKCGLFHAVYRSSWLSRASADGQLLAHFRPLVKLANTTLYWAT